MDCITVERVSLRVGGAWALRDVSFDIGRGSVFGIFGRSGSGKTSLLHLIAGLSSPTSGDVELESTSDNPWLDAQTSIALQRFGLAPELTVMENLGVFSSLWGVPRKGRLGRISMLLQLLGLAEVRNRQICTLPDGLKAAAEVARALAANSEIVAIDGLMERLDYPVKKRLWGYILARCKQGATFIIATASGEEASFCEELAVLSDGRLAFSGTPDQFRSLAENDVVVVESLNSPLVKTELMERFGAIVTDRDGRLEYRSSDADSDIAKILSHLRSNVSCVYLDPASLEDALDRVEAK